MTNRTKDFVYNICISNDHYKVKEIVICSLYINKTLNLLLNERFIRPDYVCTQLPNVTPTK